MGGPKLGSSSITKTQHFGAIIIRTEPSYRVYQDPEEEEEAVEFDIFLAAVSRLYFSASVLCRLMTVMMMERNISQSVSQPASSRRLFGPLDLQIAAKLFPQNKVILAVSSSARVSFSQKRCEGNRRRDHFVYCLRLVSS